MFTISNTCCIKRTTNDVVTYPWKVFYTSTTKKHNTVFLQVVSDTWDISSYFDQVTQTYTSKFTKGRVRFFRRHSSDTSCYTTFLRCTFVSWNTFQTIVTNLNGASDPVHEGPSAGRMLSRMGASLGARTIGFPVPAFFDQAATRRAMWSERSIKRILAVARAARLAVFGVGTLESGSGALPSQVYAGGHLTRADLAVARREGVVGDVCTVLLRGDGTWGDIDLNARATGPTPVRLARIPRRLCVVAGTGKARACVAALRARVATDLVVDDATARAVLALHQRKETS